MKIYDENKNYVGELERPKPMVQDEKWFETIEFRIAVPGELMFCPRKDKIEGHFIAPCPGSCYYNFESWIASEIPRAAPEQLKAIGMKERDGRPVECKRGDMVWAGLSACQLEKHSSNTHLIGHYRFVLEPDGREELHNDLKYNSSIADYLQSPPTPPPTIYKSCPDCARLKALLEDLWFELQTSEISKELKARLKREGIE